MKSPLKSLKRLLVAVGLLLASTAGIAQTDWPESYGTATIDASYCVSIDTGSPLQDFYQISIAHLGFADAVEAQKVFGYISNNRLTYRVDFDNQVAYLRIHADRTPEPKDVIWWNDYIHSLCN